MSSLSATVNPSIKVMCREVGRYRRLCRAHLLAYGSSWEGTTPSPKAKSPYDRFRYWSDRFDAILKMPPTSDRDDALRVVHSKLFDAAVRIDGE